MLRVENKLALITGVAGGIGAATALRFAEEGASLVLTDIRQPDEEWLAKISAASKDCLFRRCDLSHRGAVRELFDELREKFGRLDILANIAGGDFGENAGLDDVDEDNIQRNVAANLSSTIYTCQQAAALMKTQSGGAIVNMSSMTFRGSSADQYAYAASKGGVYAFTRTLAMTLGKYGIRANAVAPAMIEVSTIVDTLPDGMWEQISEAVGSTYPLGRVGQPEEVANCILFLASDEASFVSGQVLEVSGGGRL